MNDEQQRLAQLGREFLAWMNENYESLDDAPPNDSQINDLAGFGVRLISIIKSVA